MTALVIARLHLKRVFRDRTALIFMILLPVVITLVIGVSIFKSAAELSIGVVAPEGVFAEQLVQGLQSAPSFHVDRFDNLASLRKAVRRENVSAGLFIPATYDRDLRRGVPVEISLLVDPGRNAPQAVRQQIEAVAAEQGAKIQAANFAAGERAIGFEQAYDIAERASKQAPVIAVDVTSAKSNSDDLPTGFGYTAPANLVLSVFINALVLSSLIIENKKSGRYSRMLAAPTTAGQIIAGQTLGGFFVGFVQGLIILFVGAFVFGVDYGNLLGAMVLVAVISLVATSISALVGSIFRTPEQASSLGPVIGIGAGMLSGCMWPLEIVGETMRQVGHAFPQAWAMDAFIELVARGAGFREILGELLILGAFSAVLLPLAAFRLRKSLTA